MHSVRLLPVVVGLALVWTTLSAPEASAGGLEWSEGRWRLELSGFKGIHQGSRDREDDWNINGTVEYEAPLWTHATLGIRLHPIFFYHDDRNDEEIYGVGAGPTFRLYHKEERRGLFFEAGLSALVHVNRFDGNGSNLNFISEFGLGYKFDNDWHVSVKWRHISNASISDDNAGSNGIGIGAGFTF